MAQSSFADVLERLKNDANESKGEWTIDIFFELAITPYFFLDLDLDLCLVDVEGGADLWKRPQLSSIDEQEDTIGL